MWTSRWAWSPVQYVLVTFHRPRNVDSRARLAAILSALAAVAADYPVVFPMHPRTARNVKQYQLEAELAPLNVLAPTRYLEFLALMDRAGLVITDSGNIQEETTVLGVPCITLRPNTERPITVSEGTNRLFDGEPHDLVDIALEAIAAPRRPCRPHLWDGHAAERIAQVTTSRLARLQPGARDRRRLASAAS